MSETSEFTSTYRKLDSFAMEPVSSGSTCETFKFQQWGKWFLVKRLRKEKRFDPIARAAFEKEFDLGIHLDHPGIVRYYSKGEDAEGPYILEEYIEGETLSEYVKTNAPLAKDEIRRIFGELADAVSYLHSLGIIHSDIKPENIIITRQGVHPKLVDLGFASQYSYTSLSGGTPLFSAPEQFSDEGAADVRADVYSLGKVLELMANGHFKSTIRKATSDNPQRRFGTPDEIKKAIAKRSMGWPVILATLLACLFIVETFRYKELSKLRTPQQTVVVLDTSYVRTHPEPPSPPEEFKKAVREASDKCFSVLYSSYSEITDDNQPTVLDEYVRCVYAAQDAYQALIEEWVSKYPENRSDFEEIAASDLQRVTKRYLDNTQAYYRSKYGAQP